MKKRILVMVVALAAILCLFAVTVGATETIENGSCGEGLVWTLDTEGTLTISGTSAMTEWTAYSSAPWRSNCRSIKTVVIGDGVTSIGSFAFMGCSSLTTVTIGNGVISIGDHAFHGCVSLVNVTIPSGVKRIGSFAFDESNAMREITVSGSVESIGESAFIRCPKLATVRYTGTVTDWCGIDFDTFYSSPVSYGGTLYIADMGVTNLEIPENVTSVGAYAFAGNGSLISVTVPDSTISVGQGAFQYCNNLKLVTLPNSLSSIGNSAFSDCGNLVSITIPAGVKKIGDYMFDSCVSLASMEIPNGVKSIGYAAFYGCSGLTAVTIPDSVTSIERTAFSGCSGLKKVCYLGTKEQWKNVEIDVYNEPLSNATLLQYITEAEYKFGNSVQLVLIEPWGLKFNARIYTDGNETGSINYDAVEEYGCYVLYDKDNALNAISVTEETMLGHVNTQLFNNLNGGISKDLTDDRYITATITGIYTYQMNSNAYVLFYVKDDTGYHYGEIKVRNAYTLATERSQDTTGYYGALEQDVYRKMAAMYESITAYREDYFTKQGDLV